MDITKNFVLRPANNERISTMYVFVKPELDFLFGF